MNIGDDGGRAAEPVTAPRTAKLANAPEPGAASTKRGTDFVTTVPDIGQPWLEQRAEGAIRLREGEASGRDAQRVQGRRGEAAEGLRRELELAGERLTQPLVFIKPDIWR